MGLYDLDLRFKEHAHTQVPGNERDVYCEFWTGEPGELPREVVFSMVEETKKGTRHRTLVCISVEDLRKVLAYAEVPSSGNMVDAIKSRKLLEARFKPAAAKGRV